MLRRVFAIDILACPDCGGRLRLLATIEERAVVEKILTHLGLPVDPPRPSPARTPAWLPSVRNAADHEDGPAATGPTDRTTAGTPSRLHGTGGAESRTGAMVKVVRFCLTHLPARADSR